MPTTLTLKRNDLVIPLRIRINSNRLVTLYYKTKRWRKRGSPVVVPQLNARNAYNELIITFNDKTWIIMINGKDISDKFKTRLKHNGSFNNLVQVHLLLRSTSLGPRLLDDYYLFRWWQIRLIQFFDYQSPKSSKIHHGLLWITETAGEDTNWHYNRNAICQPSYFLS